jgi:PIN domain nuclease of toxin-antitoxin system
VILLDTHVWVWLAMDSKRLSRAALAAIRRAADAGGISVASISLWELATLIDQGRIRAPGTIESSVRAVIDGTSVVVHELNAEIAALATAFPRDFPADPADRIIGATARSLGLPLVTRDQRMLESSLLKTVW